MKTTTLAVLLLLGCSSTNTNPSFGTSSGGSAGAAGQAGGSPDGATDADAASCGPLMILSGSVCVDKQPALLANGSQGPAVSWTEAAAICAARGARLCTEAERDGACPGGLATTIGNEVFCSGPMNTWEWSSSTSCADRCKSPCCNSVLYPCDCSVPPTDLLSYRCCK